MHPDLRLIERHIETVLHEYLTAMTQRVHNWRVGYLRFGKSFSSEHTRLAPELSDVLSTHLPRRWVARIPSQLAQFEKDGMESYARQGEAYSRIRRDLNRLKRDVDEVPAREETRHDNL